MTNTLSTKEQIDTLIAADFPKTFGLWPFIDMTFRIDPDFTAHLIYNDPVEFIVQVRDDAGKWLDFSRGTKAEIYCKADNTFRIWLTEHDKWAK